MKKHPVPAFAGLPLAVPVVFLMALFPIRSNAFDPPPSEASLCFGNGAQPYFADVIAAVAGTELVILNINETVLADDDMDGSREVSSSVYVQVVDRTGAQQWRSPKLTLTSPDLAMVIPGGGFIPDSYLFPRLASSTFAASLYFGGIACYGTAYAVEAGGQRYLAVVAGFLAQTGNDEASGADASRVNVWILDGDTGAPVFTHKIRSRANKFLAAVSLAGIGKIDGDANDELVSTWLVPDGDGKYNMQIETYNVLTGAREDKFSASIRNVRKFQ